MNSAKQSTQGAVRDQHPGRKPGLVIWLMVRLSGLLLAILLLAHFAYTHIVYDVAETDAAFVASNLRLPLFVAWEGLILLLAIMHAVAGLWVVIGEHNQTNPGFLRLTLILMSLGTFVLGVFNLLCVLQ